LTLVAVLYNFRIVISSDHGFWRNPSLGNSALHCSTESSGSGLRKERNAMSSTYIAPRDSLMNSEAREEDCALLGYHGACGGNPLPTFRYNPLVPFSRVKNRITTRSPEKRSSNLLRAGSIKSRFLTKQCP